MSEHREHREPTHHSHYQVLGIQPFICVDGAHSVRDLKKAYKQRIIETHPDKSSVQMNSKPHFTLQQIREAFRVLSDKKLRKEYDKVLKEKDTVSETKQSDVTPTTTNVAPPTTNVTPPTTNVTPPTTNVTPTTTNVEHSLLFRDFTEMWRNLVASVGQQLSKIQDDEQFKSHKNNLASMISSFGSQLSSSGLQKTPNIEHTFEIDLASIFKREHKNINVKVKRSCQNCRATGMVLKGYEACELCQGCGGVRNGDLMENNSNHCPNCDGRGVTPIPGTTPCKVTCDVCVGAKSYIHKKLLSFSCTSKKIVFEGEADQEPGKEPGDIIIHTKPREHPKFRVINNFDLVVEKRITLAQVKSGETVKIGHLDGSKVNLDLPKKCDWLDRNYFVRTLHDQGLWINDDQRGNLVVHLKIQLGDK